MVFYMSNYELLYKTVNELLGELTPLKGHDCGELCGAACCCGGEEDGMLLFPGESTTLCVTSASVGRLAVCDGHCCRDERPLSCRIFPFFPTVDEKRRVTVRIDSRAMRICPLAQYSENVIFDRKFIRRLKRGGKLLAKDDECFAFMREITLQIEELDRFFVPSDFLQERN